jgi:AraC-like DNA-binding protein
VNGPSESREKVDYRRSIAVPGVEVIEARESPREWRQIPSEFCVVVFKTWRGRVRTRGSLHPAEPGIAFCNMPGEAMVARPDNGAGSFNVLQVQPHVFDEWLCEQAFHGQRHWAGVMKPVSPQLSSRFGAFFDAFQPAASVMELQSLTIELSELLIRELVDGGHAGSTLPTGPALRGTALMRECLNEEGLGVDLDTLARRSGLSRFQALRCFKQRYGLPPHAYQLCLRINQARCMLLEGASPADVAARCGFADQSHFTRHFKRLNGVTPMQYARAHQIGGRRTQVRSAHAHDPMAIVSRSDH